MAEVEYLLVAGLGRKPAAASHDPFWVGPGQVGVRVDHLRFDPESELHAEAADVVDERVQAVGPDRLVDVPVAEPGAVAAAVPEPAVVEDEPLDPDLRGEVRQG